MHEAFIVGVGETPFAPRRDDVNTTEIAWEAVQLALADAGVQLRDIQSAVTASQDFWEGRTISSLAVNEIVGATFKAESKTASDGALALAYAATRIANGNDPLMLVVAHCKESQADLHAVENAAFDPYVQRPLDADETVLAALQVQLSGVELEQRSRVVVAARSRSPWLDDVSIEDVEASPLTSTPLRKLERAPLMDGACALVVCDATTAARLDTFAVKVTGASTATGSYWSDRDLTRDDALRTAFADAIGSAGWDDAPERIELSAPYAHQALLWAREIGAGDDAAAFESGTLCASGGWLAGRPGVVAGLSAAIACTQALREQGSGRALAHGTTGLLGQSHHFVALEVA